MSSGDAATTLNEIGLASEVCIEIYENQILVREEVKGASEILGFLLPASHFSQN